MTRARGRGHMGQPDILGDSGTDPRAGGVNTLFWVTRAGIRRPQCWTSSPGPLTIASNGPRSRPAVLIDLGHWPRTHGSTRYPGRLWHESEGPRSRPAVLGDSGRDPRALVVDQLSRATRACVLGQAGSTSCTRRLGPGSERPRGRPAVPGDSSPSPRACGVDHRSRATRNCVRSPAKSNSSPGRVALGSEGPRS